MKSSLSDLSSSSATNGQLLMVIFILLLVFVTSSATSLSNAPPFSSTAMPDASPTISRRHRHQPPRHEPQLHPCDAITRPNSRSLCIHLHRVYHHRLPVVHVPPALLTGNEIDPQYGVEKRLVPSGPNPLHN